MTVSTEPDQGQSHPLEDLIQTLEKVVRELEMLKLSVAAAHAQASLDNCLANKDMGRSL